MKKERPALPKQIKMGPYVFKVINDPAVLEAASSGGKIAAGFSTLEAQLIGISDRKPRSHTYVADTLLHELVHCSFRVNGYEFSDAEEEEKAVLAVTTNLLHCLRENPQVVEYLTHKE